MVPESLRKASRLTRAATGGANGVCNRAEQWKRKEISMRLRFDLGGVDASDML